MVPELLARHGIKGPDVGRIQREGRLGAVTLDEVSEPRPGQRFAFVMDTRLCPGVDALAEGCDMLVIESTFLDEDERLATDHGHLTAGQAARVARDAGVRHLVLTHFSQRYTDPTEFERQARAAGFEGELTVAADLMRVPLPKQADDGPGPFPAPARPRHGRGTGRGRVRRVVRVTKGPSSVICATLGFGPARGGQGWQLSTGKRHAETGLRETTGRSP